MDEEIINNLKEIGFSLHEIRVYLLLSKIGISTAYNLAKKGGFFKSNTYEILKRLASKGIVSERKFSGKIYYEANDPNIFLHILNNKQEKLKEIVPEIRSLQKESLPESSSELYNGINAFINILYQLLEKKEPIYVYGAPKRAYELMKLHLSDFHKKRIKNKIKMYHIYNFEAIKRVKELKKMKNTYARTLPELFHSDASTLICSNYVVIAVWNPPFKIIKIKENSLADAYKKYFKILWKEAKFN
ncbi:hypothetical protein GF386_01690 [Candidatus Pacearchaeota archaeon]|nr:hypothetical protein [Candidatus Pacearchaeota archaeon]